MTDYKIIRTSDGLYDVFYPFGLRVDWGESKIQYAPTMQIDRQKVVGADADVMFGARYGVRGLTIVGYTADGYSKANIESLKALISNYLNDAYKQNIKMMYYDMSYINVRFSGVSFADNIQTGFLKVTFNFTLVNPYNYLIKTLSGNGNITNAGLYDCKPQIKIMGPATHPSVTYNGKTLTLGITLASDEYAIIFCDLYKAHKYSGDTITDVTNFVSGNYFDFLKGTYAISSNYPTQTTYEWHEKYLWGTGTAVCETYPDGYNNADTIYIKDGKIYPFDLFVNWADSDIPFVPEIELETISNGDSDGESILNTKYKSRNFTIACYSEQGLNAEAKNLLAQKVLNTLDAMRNEVKTLHFVDGCSKFPVRINGNIDSTNYAGHLAFTLGFETVSAYSEKEVVLSGETAVNNGIAPCGFKVVIPGEVTNPSVTVNGVKMTFTGSIASNLALVIDTEKKLCYTLDSSGNKVNVKKNYSAKYPLLEKGANTVTSEFEFSMTWKEKYLWGEIYGNMPIVIEESEYQALIDNGEIDENATYYVYPDGTSWEVKYYWYLISNKPPYYVMQSYYDGLGENVEEDIVYIVSPDSV